MTRQVPVDASVPARPGLASRDFLLLLAATFGMMSNYATLLSVVPLWSAEGGGGHGGAGATTGAVMATTVAAQFLMGRMTRRFGSRALLAAGALVMGAPTFLYAASSDLAPVLAVSLVRGVGFGMVTVAGAALAAGLVAPDRRGRAVGLYGLAVGLPQILVLPVSVWAAGEYGFLPVFVITGVLSILAVPLAMLIGNPPRESPDEEAGTWRAVPPLLPPWAAMFATSCALGGVASFLALAVDDSAAVATALFALSAAVMAGRWAAGVWSDRFGAGRLVVPGLVAGAVGMAGIALAADAGWAYAAVAAAGLYGWGFGLIQNDTLVVMFQRSGPDGHGTASAVWNVGFDAGTGVGAVAIGLLAGLLTLPGSFAVAAAGMAVVLPILWRDARRSPASPRKGSAGDR